MKTRSLTRKGLSITRQNKLAGVAFISPWLIGLLVFFVFPFLNTIRLSFSEVVNIKGFQMEWVGLKYYEQLFVTDVNFLPKFGAVLTDALIDLPLIIVFSLIIAVMVNKKIVGRSFFRGVFFLPVLLGSGEIMQQLLGVGMTTGADGTAVEAMSRGVMITDVLMEYLGDTVSSWVQLFLDRITTVLWASGVQIILFISGLCGISPSLYEAATVEGATEWESFWKITVPMIFPILQLNIIYTLIDSFAYRDNELVSYIFDTAKDMKYSYSATMSWVYFLTVFVIIVVVFVAIHRMGKVGER